MVEPIGFLGGLPDAALAPDLGPLVAMVMAEEPESLSYGDPRGDDALRARVGRRLGERAGVPLDAGNVVLTNGCAGALDLVARALLEPDDVVIVEALTYPGALAVFRHRQARIVPVPLDHDGLDVDALAQVLDDVGQTGRVRVIYTIASGQSPTGTTLNRHRRERIAALAEQFDALVVQDDTYGEIAYEPIDAPPIIGLAPDRTLHLGSFSKTMAPALRLGWVAAPTHIADVLAANRLDLGLPAFLQRAVGRFLDTDFDGHVAAIASHYRAKRDDLLAALDEHCGAHATWTVPPIGFFVWLRLHGTDLDALADAGRIDGVTFLPGPYFSAGAPDRTGLRLAFGQCHAEDLVEGARRLGAAFERTLAPAQ